MHIMSSDRKLHQHRRHNWRRDVKLLKSGNGEELRRVKSLHKVLE